MSVSPAARLDVGPPRSEVSTELAALVAQRDALRDRVEAIDSEQREANERAANTSVALAELERRALAGDDVGGQRKKLEAELAKAGRLPPSRGPSGVLAGSRRSATTSSR